MRKAQTTKAKPEPQPTIGQYIDSRLTGMAYGGYFGDPGSMSKRAALEDIIGEYLEKYRTIRYM